MNESFTTNTGAVTHDSDPRKLRMLAISQDPSVLFQQGETVLEDYGTDVNLSHAHPIADIATPAVPAPIMSELTGGAGNELRFTLRPPSGTAPTATQLTAGAFGMSFVGPPISYWNNGTFQNLRYDGESLSDWWGPLGFVSEGKRFNAMDTGHWVFDIIFTDETSAAIDLTWQSLTALADAQGYAWERLGIINITSLLLPYANASGGKMIASVHTYKTQAFGNVGAYTVYGQLLLEDSNGARRNVIDGSGPNTFINLTELSTDAVYTPTAFGLASTPHAYIKIWSMGNAVRIAPEYAVSDTTLTVTTPFVAPGLNGMEITYFDNEGHQLGATFDATVSGLQTHSATDTAELVLRSGFYHAQLLPPDDTPITVAVPVAATDLIAWATACGEASHSSGLITGVAGTMLNGYTGYELIEWSFFTGYLPPPTPYASTGTPINSSSTLWAIALTVNGVGTYDMGSFDNLPTLATTLHNNPLGVIFGATVNVTVAFRLLPEATPDVYYPLLVSEPYEIRQRNQITLRPVCKPPLSARPGDYTTPEFTVRVFASQGEAPKRTIMGDNGRYTLWTPIPFNVQGAAGISKDNLSKSIGCYVFEDYLPDNWAGSAITFDRDYLAPWNYIRVVITPTADGETTPDLSGFIMSIVANAREI